MDINTIFYFPSSLTFEEYSNKLDQGEISERTIVFADAQKAIYKGGKKYGGTSLLEFHDLIDTLYDDSWISDEINGVKGNVLQSIARLDLFNTLVTNVSSRLDTEIQERDNNIQAKVEALMEDAAWLQENFPQGVTQWDAGWNQNLEAYLQTVGYWTTDGNNQTITQWSKLRQDLNSIETSVDSLKVDGNLTQALTTSILLLITDRIASLQLGTTYATVARVGDVEKVLEWMYSGLESSASEETTFSEMSSMAKNDFVSAISDIRTQVNKVANGDFVAQTELASKVGDTIAAMLLQSSSDNALASMSARLDTVEQNTGTLSQNVASLVLGVTGSSSTANLATVVANKLAGFTTSADIASAKSEIYSAIGAKDGSDHFISIADLKTQADANGSNITAIATRVRDLETNQSGFVASSNLDSAVAEMFASSGDGQNSTAKANIVALVRDNKSELNITAEDVHISAENIDLGGYLTGGNAEFVGDVLASLFQTGSNNEYGICVITDTFDELLANKKKAYFGYDSEQGGVTMWFYQNNLWKKLDLASSAVLNDPDMFAAKQFYNIPDLSIKVLDTDSLQPVTLYFNRSTNKYYTSASTSSPAEGIYYSIGYPAKYAIDNLNVVSVYGNTRCNEINYLVCGCVREIKEDGTITNSGLTSNVILGCITRSSITNGLATTTGTATVGYTIKDVYIGSNNEVKKAVAAVSILKVAPESGMTSTSGSVFQRVRYYNTKYSRYEYGSTDIITLTGRIVHGDDNIINNPGTYGKGAGILAVKYISSTLEDSLNTDNHINYYVNNYSDYYYNTEYPAVDTVSVVHTTANDFPLPYSATIPSYTETKFYKQ